MDCATRCLQATNHAVSDSHSEFAERARPEVSYRLSGFVQRITVGDRHPEITLHDLVGQPLEETQARDGHHRGGTHVVPGHRFGSYSKGRHQASAWDNEVREGNAVTSEMNDAVHAVRMECPELTSKVAAVVHNLVGTRQPFELFPQDTIIHRMDLITVRCS
jgi:hypothetical protein